MMDKIILDVPLFIRLLEYAREDAKTDMDLHRITENITILSEMGEVLTMDQYDDIVGNTKDLQEMFRMVKLANIR